MGPSSQRILLALLVLFVVTAVHGYECPYQECYCTGVFISCVSMGLNSTPSIISTNTSGLTSLQMDLNSITTIPNGSLPANLTDISFDYNPVTVIDISAFDGSAETLQSLGFWGAEFSTLPAAIARVRALKYLSIYHSGVVNWGDDVMQSLGPRLTNLDLIDAGTIANSSWIQYFSVLEEIRIESCSVTSLPENAFNLSSHSLKVISLLNNSLTAVPKSLAVLTNLTKLNLGNNQIVNISWLPPTRKLRSLFLDNNKISDAVLLSDKLRLYSESLTTLTLNDNAFAVIPDLGFLTQVGKLDFTNNQLSNASSGNLSSSVFGLDFSNNRLPAVPRVLASLNRVIEVWIKQNLITSINGSQFPSNPIWVYLDHNLITDLVQNSFPFNSTIKYLHLHYNPIRTISDSAFQNLPQLEYLGLSGSRITRLPLALTALKKLVTFHADECTDLVCTCDEKVLAPLLTPVLPGNAQGNCGETSIYTFFKNYISACP